MNTKEKKEETKTDLLKQLPADFFKQFKNMREIEDFFSELFKAGVQNYYRQRWMNILAMKNMQQKAFTAVIRVTATPANW